MFCSKCGKEIPDDAAFCPSCGASSGSSSVFTAPEPVKVMLDPKEVVEHKDVSDSSKSLRGQGKTFGLILMMLAIIGDLVSMFAIGFDAFIPITIGAAVVFFIGFFLRMFSP